MKLGSTAISKLMLGTSPVSRVMLGTTEVWSAMDADAAAYIAAVEAAGATVSAGQKSAISAFVVAGKTEGWWTPIKRLYLPIWALEAPNAICMASRTSGSFVGNVTHAAGTANTTSPTGYFIPAETPGSLGATANDASIFSMASSGSQAFMGCGGALNSRLLVGAVGSTNRAFIPSAAVGATGSTDTLGFIMGSRLGDDTMLFQRKSSGWISPIVLTAVNTTALPLFPPVFLGNFNNNGAVSTGRATVGSFSAYGHGLGFSAALGESFSLALKTLWETCTGLTLP